MGQRISRSPAPVLVGRIEQAQARQAEREESQQVNRSPAKVAEAPGTTSLDRALLIDREISQLPPTLRPLASSSCLGEVLAATKDGGALSPSDAAGLIFEMRNADLTRGDYLALRKHILLSLPKERAPLNRTKAATGSKPGAEEIVQLLLPWTPDRGRQMLEVSSLEAAEKAVAKLEQSRDELHTALKNGDPDAATKLSELSPRLSQQRAIAEGFSRWAPTCFAQEIARFRAEGRAVDPADAGSLLYALQRHGASEAELGALRDSLLAGARQIPPSANVNPPTVESVFALMTGVEAKSTVRELDDQIKSSAGSTRRELQEIRDGLVDAPRRMIADCIKRFHETGRGFDPYYKAPTKQLLDRLELEGPQLERLREALLENLPPNVDANRARSAIEKAKSPGDLVEIFTGEAFGARPLPLSRAKLTRIVADTQKVRGKASLARVRLLDGRNPAQLEGHERRELASLDQQIRAASDRLDEAKSARAGLNATRGERWLDRLEVDFKAGGAVGIPLVFSGSIMAGVDATKADPDTGWREIGISAYAMPAFSVGGYAKLDAAYTRSGGLSTSMGGGVDAGGFWGGPGGDSWGNIFAGGWWVPQIVNLGAGYGVKEGQAYGAFILSNFWPPKSPAAGRTDIVIRHPSFAVGAEATAEVFRKVGESAPVGWAKDKLGKAGGVLKRVARPVVDPIAKGASETAFQFSARVAARGLESEDDHATFIDCMRTVTRAGSEISKAEGKKTKKVALARDQLDVAVASLEELCEANPAHAESHRLLVSAHHLRGDARSALEAAERGLSAARTYGSSKSLNNAREDFVVTALAQNKNEAAWPVLNEWVQNTKDVKPRIFLLQWLANDGRMQEAKEIAEGLAAENPRSFQAKRALAAITGLAPIAEVPT